MPFVRTSVEVTMWWITVKKNSKLDVSNVSWHSCCMPLSPQLLDEDMLSITLKAKDIGDAGMLGIGWGGVTMFTAQVGEVTLLNARGVPAPQHARLRTSLPAPRGDRVD